MKNKKKILLILIYSSILLSIIFLNPFEIIKAERNIENKTYLNEVDQEFNKGFNKIKVIVEVEEMQPKILGQLIFRDSIKIREKIIEDTRINKSIKHRFNSFNGFSAELTKEEIENLMREKKVKRISLVKKYKLFLEDSAPLINATQTWGVVINGVNLTGLGQTACIIDTGVDYNHSDLGNCFGNNNQSSSCKIIGGYDFCADDTACNTVDSDPMDVHGHGTNIAGIISANGSIKGIAPDSRIIMIKASNSSGIFFSDDLIAGIEWCVNNATIFNISVISMSLGSEDVYTTYCDNLNSQFTNAINSAVQKNISVVVSTGNEYNTTAISYPSCIKNVTRVGSTTKTDEISNFSNRWGLDMLFAPGSNINSTYLNNNYIIGSGTSMAAPHVSGAILIIKQALQLVGDNFTPSEIFELLNKTGKRINDTNGNGLNYSRIEVYSAINGIDGEKYNDILFNSSFEGGNLINVTYVSGNILGQRKYKASINYSIKNFSENHWWFYFNMKNVSDKKITIEIENLSSEDFNEGRWQSKHPFYSYNITDQDNWARISYGNFLSGNNITKNFSITIQPTEDSVWIAPIPPYTLTMRDNLLNSYSSNQYLNLTNLGVTPLGYNLTLATITNQKFSNEKKHKIYIIAQQHSFESIGSYEVEGIIKFLLSENETAEALRRSYIFRIIPIINVDGVYSGTSRYTPFRNDSQYDLNRVWFNNESLIINDSTTPEINWTLNDIINFMPDAFFDLHGDGTNKTDNYFIRAVNNEQINLLLNNLSRGRENNSDYWPETGARLTSNEDSNTSNRAVYTRLGLNFSLILESPYNNLTNTTEHPVPYNPQTIADWKKWGEKLILGIYSYFQDIYWINVTPSSINKGGNITIEANIFRENINKVWYNITNSSGSHGTGFMENNSLTYYKTSYNTTNLSAGWYNVTIYANDSSNDIVKLSRKIFVSVTSEGGNNQSGGESNNNSNSNEDSTDQSSEKKQEVQNKSLQEISETNNTFLYPKEEITIPREKILEGYSTTLKLKEGLSFEIYKKEENKKEIHELFLNEIMNDSANLTIKSEPINFLIRLNEEKKFNLTSPDYYNLKIRLNEIIDKEKINLTIKEIYESIEKENFILLLLEKVKKKIKILALSFVFVMIIISYFFIKKIRKNSVVRGSRRSR